MITRNYLWLFLSISINWNLIVKWNNSKFSIMSSILHIRDLLVYCGLKTLHSAHISNISLSLQILIGSISKFHKFLQLIDFVSFKLMFALYRLRTAHWSWLINTENNWYVFFTVNFFILDLSRSFKDIVYSFTLRFFFIFKRYLVIEKTKFTFPILFVLAIQRFYNANSTMNIKISFALFTRNWITSS